MLWRRVPGGPAVAQHFASSAYLPATGSISFTPFSVSPPAAATTRNFSSDASGSGGSPFRASPSSGQSLARLLNSVMGRPQQQFSYWLHVTKVPWSVSPDTLKLYFEQFGRVDQVKLAVDSETQKFKGWGTVIFKDAKSLLQALNTKHELEGKQISVMLHKSSPTVDQLEQESKKEEKDPPLFFR
eukprot:gnl/Spiro4/7724_TR4065_c0_g1_i1.p1 gnl/Spiro4/7724_TR4065_c0_g1~~gnl/Spiro4/7724_TR4065_c0_g1_i1.p1  ORF type:complete len:185 (+),score=22.24 gnl/Spiro4/7724_TR4065_c0_g1_i1:68-622(+)